MATKRRNILLITTDQQRADTLGTYGSKLGATPNLDALAKQGTVFDQAFCQHPYCQPSRWTILTGQHPRTHGVWNNGVDPTPTQLREAFSTRAGLQGIRTGFVGKAHLATNMLLRPFSSPYMEAMANAVRMPDDWTGPYMGFDWVQLVQLAHYPAGYGPWPLGLHYGRHLARDGVLESVRRFRLASKAQGLQPAPDAPETWHCALPEELHHTTWITDRAIEFLQQQRQRDDSFFLWVSYPDPHHPLDPPAPWCFRYKPEDMQPPRRDRNELEHKPPLQKRFSEGLPFVAGYFNPPGGKLSERELRTMMASYYGMVAQLDHGIGRVLKALSAAGMEEETLVIYTVDHGELLGDHGLLFKGPFHYDGLVKVPLVFRGPGIPVEHRVQEPVGTVDLVPTFEEYQAILRGETLVEGSSLWPVMAGHETRDFALCENDTRFALLPVQEHVQTLVSKTHKLNLHVGRSYGELYDRVNDPGEVRNLWSELPALRTAMTAELLARLPAWREGTRRKPVGFAPA